MTNHQDIPTLFQTSTVIFDGAMGTELYRRNIFTNRCYDELCLSQPELIRQIHQDYADAGADVLTTNSFGANQVSLGHFGLAEQTADINRRAAKLAREVADQSERAILVAGSIGPAAASEKATAAQLQAAQAAYLVEGGVDFILFETMPDRQAIQACAEAMANLPDTPFAISFTIFDNLESSRGEALECLLAPLPGTARQPFAWGLNCGVGPDAMLSAVEKAVSLTPLPLIVQPNAGTPKRIENRTVYLCSPEYLTTYAKRFTDLGARAVGGCCGTTPDHIRDMARSLKPLTQKRVQIEHVTLSESVELKEPVPFAQRSKLAYKLANGQWLKTIELLPPRGFDMTSTIQKAKTCYRQGIDAINLPDGPRASCRLSPFYTAMRIEQEAHIETILHFCCRDRNLIGMQADLLACAAAGVANILFVTGDPPKLGNYPFQISGVFDTDAIGIARVQDRLNRGVDLGGQAICPQTAAVIGVGADPNAIDMKRELRRIREKVEAGADFIITQPVFDPEALLRFLDDIQELGTPVIAGVWPLASYRNATFMQNEVPGVVVPDQIMQRMASVESREDQLAMGIQIAREIVQRIRDRLAGIQVSAPFGNVSTALAVTNA